MRSRAWRSLFTHRVRARAATGDRGGRGATRLMDFPMLRLEFAVGKWVQAKWTATIRGQPQRLQQGAVAKGAASCKHRLLRFGVARTARRYLPGARGGATHPRTWQFL